MLAEAIHMTEATEKYITVKEAAELLSVSTRSIYRMIEDGELTGYRVGRRATRLKLSEVLAHPEPMEADEGEAGDV